MTDLEVTAVHGRYPDRPKARFKSDNIEARVIASGPAGFVIRLDDSSEDVFWMELRVSLRRTAATRDGHVGRILDTLAGGVGLAPDDPAFAPLSDVLFVLVDQAVAAGVREAKLGITESRN